jgi:hypothetical protein
MGLNESLAAGSDSAPIQDIGRCDYMKGDFEKEMYAVKAALQYLGVGIIGSRGERNPEYFGNISNRLSFRIKKASENGGVELVLNGKSEMTDLSEVVGKIKKLADDLGVSHKE